jgi:hypothetical protein
MADLPRRSLPGAIEERLLVPAYSSRWSRAPIIAHRGMALPFQLTGRVRKRIISFGGDPLELVEIGREKLLRPLGTRLFGELPAAVEQVTRVLWSPAALSREGSAGLVMAEVHRWMADRFRREGWLLVPQSVRWQGELAKLPPADCSHGLLENMRKVRRQGFELEQSTSAEDWEAFYDVMVGPQALARHGPTAWIPSRQLMKEFAAAGILHFITRSGERVAGICTVPRADTLWLAISGVRHGDPALLRQGAGFAILSLTIDWARSNGFRAIDAGRTGPFVNDGLQQFKRKWGLVPVSDPLAHLAAVRVNSPSAAQAFAREPVLVEDGSSLRAYAGQ